MLHFDNFGMEIHAGDLLTPDKPSKTEVLFVSKPPKMYVDFSTYDNTVLSPINLGNSKFFPIVDKFCYLGCLISRDCKDSIDVANRIKKASNAFGAMRKSLFSSRTITIESKGIAYYSLILPILLYGAETWSLTEALLRQLRNFHHSCVRAMCRVNRNHVYMYRISTKVLLQSLNLQPIEHYVFNRQLSWFGHTARMPFHRLPRKLLSCWVHHKRPRGSPEFTYGRGIKKALKWFEIGLEWHDSIYERNEWRKLINNVMDV